jgi:hypothetical protein
MHAPATTPTRSAGGEQEPKEASLVNALVALTKNVLCLMSKWGPLHDSDPDSSAGSPTVVVPRHGRISGFGRRLQFGLSRNSIPFSKLLLMRESITQMRVPAGAERPMTLPESSDEYITKESGGQSLMLETVVRSDGACAGTAGASETGGHATVTFRLF